MADIKSSQENANPVVVITGSVGKSEVARLLSSGLAFDGSCSLSDNRKTPPTSENPQTAFSLQVVDCLGEMSVVTSQCDACIITPVTSNDQAYINIFSGMKSGDVAIIADDENACNVIEQAELKSLKIMRVSLERDNTDYSANDVWVERIEQQSDCSCVIAHIAGERIIYKISLPGQQAVMNSLLALTAIKAVSGDMAIAAISFTSQKARAGFGREMGIGDDGNIFTLVDYSGHMNMLSLKGALDHMCLIETGKHNHRIAVLSDFDSSVASDEKHLEALKKHMVKAGITRVLTLGTEMASLMRAVGIVSEEFSTNTTLQRRLQSMAKRGDVVLVMGTPPSEMAELIEALQEHFDINNHRFQAAAE